MTNYRHYDFPNTLPGEQTPVSDEGIGFGSWIAIIFVTMLVSALVTAGIFFVMFRAGGSERAFPPDEAWPESDSWRDADEAKWSEGKANAGLISSALKVIRAEESGAIPPQVVTSGNMAEIAEKLDLEADEFQSSYFSPEDYHVEITDADAGHYIIRVRSSMPEGPAGTWYLDHDGNGWMED